MSQSDLKDSFTVLPGGRLASCGIDTSRLCPPVGAQPKSLPEPDHQACDFVPLSPVSKAAGSSSCRPGSFATNICELCTLPSGPFVSVYGVPSGRCQVIVPVSCLESVMPETVCVEPGARTCGTTQPSS